jgi:leader peptidase (prepilin peptidase)/N-methyltransferase
MFKLATGTEGMGYGDFKLLAAMGAWLGWQFLPMLVLFASLTAAIIGMTAILLKRSSRDQPISFGPFLAAAGFAVFYFGEQLQGGYVRLFSI